MGDDGVSRIADLRGGPSTAAGIEYQVLIATHRTLVLLDEARYAPASQTVVRLEPRELVDGGQVGFDFGWEAPEVGENWEIKSSPTIDDVRDFLKSSAAQRSERRTRLVHGGMTAAVDALASLIRHAGEARSLDQLRELAGTGTARERTLLDHAGDDPLATLRRIEPPRLETEEAIKDIVDVLCRHMASPGRLDDLRETVAAEVRSGLKVRGTIGLASLVERLTNQAVLARPAKAVPLGEDPQLLSALSLLQSVPLPLPGTVVASALDLSVGEVRIMLSDVVENGSVLHEDGEFSASRPPRVDLQHYSGQERERALKALIASADSGSVSPRQSVNARVLSELEVEHRPDLVARVFPAFDKPSKAYGDLWLTWELARLSTRAVLRAADSATTEESRELAMLRARNYICGQAWVLQRVGELDDAATLMREAAELAEFASDPRNSAFAAKCQGRLCRMRAERLALGDPRRDELLEESDGLLTRAEQGFTELHESVGRLQGDIGECASLLARTRATGDRLELARVDSLRAHGRLDPTPMSKAHADLLILDAEITLLELERTEEQPSRSLIAHRLEKEVHRVLEARERFARLASRETSEVVARADLVLGRVAEVRGERTEARGRYEQVVEAYQRLRYPSRAGDARWRIEMLAPGGVPDELLDAFDLRADDGEIKQHALEEYRATHARESAGPMPARDVTSLLDRARRTVNARRPKWGEDAA